MSKKKASTAVDFVGPGQPLTQSALVGLLGDTGIEPEALWSVLSVETTGCGYLADRRPKILFERHVFSRLTNRQYDGTNPDVSDASAGGYGPGGANQYVRLAEAIGLNQEAALKSASWGLGQIMGENTALAGFEKVEAFVAAMVASEDAQLNAMVQFLKTTGTINALLHHDWPKFARSYNGPNYAAHNYDGLLGHFYGVYKADGLPDLRIRAAQVYLTFEGFSPGLIDGIAGNATTRAVKSYQAATGSAQTGLIDDNLMAQLSV
jgi:hypothetical protein